MIEFRWHSTDDDFWVEYKPTVHKAVRASNPNYYLRIDGEVYKTYTDEILEKALEKEEMWKKLAGTRK